MELTNYLVTDLKATRFNSIFMTVNYSKNIFNLKKYNTLPIILTGNVTTSVTTTTTKTTTETSTSPTTTTTKTSTSQSATSTASTPTSSSKISTSGTKCQS